MCGSYHIHRSTPIAAIVISVVEPVFVGHQHPLAWLFRIAIKSEFAVFRSGIMTINQMLLIRKAKYLKPNTPITSFFAERTKNYIIVRFM